MFYFTEIFLKPMASELTGTLHLRMKKSNDFYQFRQFHLVFFIQLTYFCSKQDIFDNIYILLGENIKMEDPIVKDITPGDINER